MVVITEGKGESSEATLLPSFQHLIPISTHDPGITCSATLG